jgi:hypothetical protein
VYDSGFSTNNSGSGLFSRTASL